MGQIAIGGRAVGDGAPVFIIAEAGVNHNGEMVLARRLIEVAASAGVEAVKFQTFVADRVASASAQKAAYQGDARESQVQMLRRLELAPAAYSELQAHAQRQGLLFLSTPFDEGSVDLLDGLGVPAFKIGSGEITNLPFLEYVARKGRPLILSTGMSDMKEVGAAVQVIRRAGNERLVLMRDLLANDGSIYVHCDWRVNAYIRSILDEVFGPMHFRNEIIWQRTLAKAHTSRQLPNNHDVIFCYQKSDDALWNAEAMFQPYDLSNSA